MRIRFLSLTIGLLATISALAADSTAVKLIPQIHGAFRGRYEVSTLKGEQRFQVRNARVTLEGQVTKHINYFFQTDLCDRGKMKILDAYARLAPSKALAFQLGQFRMPLGIETFRAPQNYIFANRSFVGKEVCNFRAVGAKVGYSIPHTPLLIEAGIFNPNTIGDHSPWHKPMAYSGKATLSLGNTKISAGMMSREPDSVRVNIADAAVVWESGRWLVAGEYMYEHYTNKAAKASHSYVAQANYTMPIKAWEFNRLSFQGRFDGMTDNSTGTRQADGTLGVDYPSRNRVTVGSTISYYKSAMLHVDLRANYEKYFYHNGVHPGADDGDKVCVELVVRF